MMPHRKFYCWTHFKERMCQGPQREEEERGLNGWMERWIDEKTIHRKKEGEERKKKRNGEGRKEGRKKGEGKDNRWLGRKEKV